MKILRRRGNLQGKMKKYIKREEKDQRNKFRMIVKLKS